MSVTVVYRAANSIEANIVCGALQAEGVEAWVQGEILENMRGEVPFDSSTLPQVCVASPDAERALAVLAEIDTDHAD